MERRREDTAYPPKVPLQLRVDPEVMKDLEALAANERVRVSTFAAAQLTALVRSNVSGSWVAAKSNRVGIEVPEKLLKSLEQLARRGGQSVPALMIRAAALAMPELEREIRELERSFTPTSKRGSDGTSGRGSG